MLVLPHTNKCIWCYTEFRKKENFDKHTSRCLNILCSFCGIRKGDFSSKAKYMEHYKQHLNETFFCNTNLCSKAFKSEKDLRDHKRKVHVDNVECSECAMTFINNESIPYWAGNLSALPGTN